jgi:hypothetical protein
MVHEKKNKKNVKIFFYLKRVFNFATVNNNNKKK